MKTPTAKKVPVKKVAPVKKEKRTAVPYSEFSFMQTSPTGVYKFYIGGYLIGTSRQMELSAFIYLTSIGTEIKYSSELGKKTLDEITVTIPIPSRVTKDLKLKFESEAKRNKAVAIIRKAMKTINCLKYTKEK